MAGLGFAVAFAPASNVRSIVEEMARAATHRGDARIDSAPTGSAAAAALGAGARTATDGAGRLIVADSRLDEVAGLATELGLEAGRDEASLILGAFERWGAEAADRLRGDFAFVIWDAPTRSVFAARDIFGTRPLFFTLTRDGMAAASEITQLVTCGAAERRVDERTLVASLAGRTASPRWTYFEGVRRVLPGEVLQVDASGARHRRFWAPPRLPRDRGPGEVYAGELRELVREVVGARLDASSRPGLLLSGGIDSMAIAAVSSALRAERAGPALETYSFGYSGFPEADERTTSGPLARLLGEPNTEIPAADAYPLADFGSRAPDLDGPDLLMSHVLMRQSLARARADGVDLMMTGHRSDPLFSEGIFDYLGVLRRHGPAAVLQQARRQAEREGTSRRAVLKRDLVRRLPAAVWPRYRGTAIRDSFRRVVPGGVHPPPWVRAEVLAAHSLRYGSGEAVPASRLSGEARRRRHEAIIAPGHAASAEYLERISAQASIRYADPWSDRRLADWVLSIPADRITVDGTDKWVLREAMRDTLPEFARRGGGTKAHPGTFYQYGVLEGSATAVQELMSRPRTVERGYVDAAELRRSYASYQSGTWPGLLEWNAFWRWLTLEHWLRAHDL